MPKHIQLTIDEPCHEDWEQMTPTDRGRFCGSCQKQVMDFTGMSDAQLVAFFKKKSTGSVCGRFFNDQLDKSMLVPKKRIPWIKYFFQLTLPLFLTSLKSTAQKGKVMIKRTETETVCSSQLSVKLSLPYKIDPVSERKNISGVIIDEEGKPVSYASVSIKGTQLGTAADSSGIFTFGTLEKNRDIVLSISCIGFASSEFFVPYEKIIEGAPVVVQLNSKTELSDVTVISYATTKGRIVVGGMAVVKQETPFFDPIEEPVTSDMIVYPNPSVSGTTINIASNKMGEGYYTFQFLNLSGQLVIQKEIWVDKEARILNMPIPRVAAATYFITMINKQSGKKFTNKLIIQ